MQWDLGIPGKEGVRLPHFSVRWDSLMTMMHRHRGRAACTRWSPRFRKVRPPFFSLNCSVCNEWAYRLPIKAAKMSVLRPSLG